MTGTNAPFTYFVGWSHLNKYYIGVRYAKSCSPVDLWTKYFTSSDRVATFRKANGEPDILVVIKVHITKTQALEHEDKLLRRLNAVRSDKYLNACRAAVTFITTPESARKAANARRGRKRPEHAEKLRGRKRPDLSARLRGPENPMNCKESVDKLRGENNPAKRAENRAKISAGQKGKKHPIKNTTCPFCNKTGGAQNMTRYHFDNCKQKAEITSD